MSELIHHDIIEELLTRLQVEDLIRCKSVCKSWNSLITSHRFVKSHLNYNRRKNADNNEIGDTRVNLFNDHFDKDIRHEVYRLVGSSNGLVCISHWDREFFVVNPSTGEVKELRNPPQETNDFIEVSGFGYASSIDDYKVVIGFYTYCWKKFSFKVLTLKSNIWRSVAGAVQGYSDECGTLCNGAIHWLFCDRSNRKVIVSFDLSKETIKEIATPDQCDMFKDLGYALGTIKDCLCIIPYRDIHLKKTEEVEIWVMKNYNVQESWERWLVPPGYNRQKTIIKYTPPHWYKYGHLQIWMLEKGSFDAVLVHSLERPHYNTYIKLATNSECNYNFNRHVYMKSLVSPHGMGDDDSGNVMLEEGSRDAVLAHSLERPGKNTHIKLSTNSECNYEFNWHVCMKSLVFPHGMGDDDSDNVMLEESPDAAVLVHSHVSLKNLECRTVCNKSQRFAKISQDRKASLKKKVKEYAKKPLRPKHKARGKTKTCVIEYEEGTDMSGDDYDGILDHNLKLVERRTYTFKDFLYGLKEDSPVL